MSFIREKRELFRAKRKPIPFIYRKVVNTTKICFFFVVVVSWHYFFFRLKINFILSVNYIGDLFKNREKFACTTKNLKGKTCSTYILKYFCLVFKQKILFFFFMLDCELDELSKCFLRNFLSLINL